MPTLNAADLNQIRTPRPGRRLNLYVYQPVTLWTGTVGGAPSRGDRVLTVATVSGNPADILEHSTVWVRDAAGDMKDYPSKVRARSYIANTLTVAENNIDWANGDILYAVRFFELWPRIPYIDDSNPAAPVQYKDRDIAWASDAQAQPPKANGGVPVVAALSGGSVDVVFQNETSFSCPGGGGVVSYQWAALGGAPAVVAGGAATATVTYRYTTAGYYYVSLTVTDANGQTGVHYVPVIIDDGTYRVARVAASDRYWDRNGWSLGRNLIGTDADDSPFYDGGLVLLTADDTQVADGAFYDNRSNLRWCGWLMEDRTSRAARDRQIAYRAVSSVHVLNTIPSFGIRFGTSGAPSDWYEFTQLNVDSVAYLLLLWHSTAMFVCQYHSMGEWTNRLRTGENCEGDQSLLDQVNGVLNARIGTDLRGGRQGELRVKRDEWRMSAAEQAALDTVMTLADTDWFDVRYGARRHRARIRETKLLGVDGAGTAYMSGAPPEVPLDGGRPFEQTYLSPVSQAELNQWAGQTLAVENWSVPLLLRMRNEYDVIDPAREEFIAGTLSSFDSKLPDGPYTVTSVRFTDDYQRGMVLSEWELLPDPGAYSGTTRTIPTSPPEPDPPDLPIDYPDIIPDPIDWPDTVFVCTKDKGVYYSTDFTGPAGAMPTWTHMTTGGLPGGFVILQFAYDRANPTDVRLFVVESTGDSLWRLESGDANWTQVLTTAQAGATTGDGPNAGARIEWVSVDPVTGDVYALYRTESIASARLWVMWSTSNGDNGTFTGHAAPGGTAGWFKNVQSCIRAYNDNLLMFSQKVADETLPNDVGNKGPIVYYDSSGAPVDGWTYENILDTPTTQTLIGGSQDWLNPIAYAYMARWDTTVNSHDLAQIEPGVGYTVIDDTNNLRPEMDSLWFSLISSGPIRGIAPGRGDGENYNIQYPRLYVSDDYFATTPLKWTFDYHNIAMLAYPTHDQSDDFLIVGADECDDGGTDFTHHHILVADPTVDPVHLYSKAGDNVDVPPGYTDAIPDDAGGVCYDGIQVVY